MRAFISYSHDSAEHIEWVETLSQKLSLIVEQVVLDKYHLQFGDDVNRFMEREIAQADLVFVVCTPDYVKKSDNRKGGVGYESVILSTELLQNQDSRKFIPILRRAGDSINALPKFLGNRLYVDMTKDDGFGKPFDQLVRHLQTRKGQEQTGAAPPTPQVNVIGTQIEGPTKIKDFTNKTLELMRLFAMDSQGFVTIELNDLLELFPDNEFTYVSATSLAAKPDYVALARMAGIQLQSYRRSRKLKSIGISIAGPKQEMRLSETKAAFNAIRVLTDEDAHIVLSVGYRELAGCVTLAYA